MTHVACFLTFISEINFLSIEYYIIFEIIRDQRVVYGQYYVPLYSSFIDCMDYYAFFDKFYLI
jgi:hypothetical protein